MKSGNILLEKYRLGEITAEEMRALKSAYPDPEDLEREIQKLELSDREILDKYTARDMSAQINARLASGGRAADTSGRIKPFPVFKAVRYSAIAAAAALVLVLGLSFYNPETNRGVPVAASEGLSAERIKGLKPGLKIYRSSGGTAEILANRDSVAEKDLLQIEYIAGSFKYGVIFSIDGRGTLTMHFPTYSGVAAELDNNGAILLPYAYELDDAPDFERFFFVTGGGNFNIDEVLDAAYELASKGKTARRQFLDIPDSYYQTTILLQKGAER
jgi:hypothetical protein